ncbi:hypothetical protein MLD38_022872 [Melastoma candidum]|uniref:Uncharacterized protein n=1 Tax=Melastoma candidum TaxID=119954 RepID=A0ACB9QP54_9MYRT|nr:hypothetical protein MLD38_022872 [Melastoma candidum]
MADHSRSPTTPTTDLSTLLGLRPKSSSIFNISKAYKFLGEKWHGSNNHHHRQKSSREGVDEGGKEGKVRNTSDDDASTSEGSSLSSLHNKTADDKFRFRRSFLSRSGSRRSTTPTPSSLSRSTSRNDDRSIGGSSILSRNKSSRRSVSTSRQSSYVEETRSASITRSMSSQRGKATPIVFSQTAARKKPLPIEKKLECTLEDLCFGCVKYIVITRDVLSNTGMIQEEESLKIMVKPGWKKGTQIKFEGKGDEKPGYLPADIVFLIEEKRHPLFKRRESNLEIGVEIPLVQALTGCSLTVPLLGGDKMSLYIDKVIFPGYEQAIPGQGMPDPKENGKRGELRITFFVRFPSELSDEQRSEICNILEQDSSS